jgi:hypothetical protein
VEYKNKSEVNYKAVPRGRWYRAGGRRHGTDEGMSRERGSPEARIVRTIPADAEPPALKELVRKAFKLGGAGMPSR